MFGLFDKSFANVIGEGMNLCVERESRIRWLANCHKFSENILLFKKYRGKTDSFCHDSPYSKDK